jgi:polyhydroxyalkanoate synthesis regulator protein
MKKNIHVGFDIDETFIHSIDIKLDQEPYVDADFNIKDVDTGKYSFSTYIRPNARLLLNYVKENYNIFFYTRSSKDYALEVLKEFGMENEKLFHSKYIEVETVDTLYEGLKKFKVKRLDKIANKLCISIDDMIFIDDIKNRNEIRPIHVVTQVPAYYGNDIDNIMTTLMKAFKACEQLNEQSIKEYFKGIDLLVIEKNENKNTLTTKNKIKNKSF